MLAREWVVLAVLSTALFCTSCAVSPGTQERHRAVEAEIEAILSEPLDAEQYGRTQRCLSHHEYRDFRAIDERRIVFEGRRGRLWLNTLCTRCPDLRHATVLRVRSMSSMGRICEMDTFVAGDWFTWPWYRRWPWYWGTAWGTGMTCSLGKFQPVTKVQVATIEDAIGSR
jgi:hypothetical protein